MKTQLLTFGPTAVLIAIVLTWLPSRLAARAPGDQEPSGCDYRVSPTRLDLQGRSQSGFIHVDTSPGCAWTVTSDVSWITLGSSGGTGPGAIAYVIPQLVPTYEMPMRQGRIRVRWNTPTAGQNVLVTQIADSCKAAFSPAPGPTSAETFGGAGGGGNFWVLAEPPFSGSWFVASASDWITFTYPPLGVFGYGDSQTFFAVSPNPSNTPRDGAVVFCSGQIFNVHQAGRSVRNGRFVPSDFDDDGVVDLAVYRPSTGGWHVLQSRTGYSYSDFLSFQWGQPPSTGKLGDLPVPGDFDGDSKTDLALYRPQGLFGSAPAGNWLIRYSSNQHDTRTATNYPWGTYRYSPEDVPLLADFNADGKSDFALYRPSTGLWDVLFTSVSVPGGGGPLTAQWGLPGDVPVPADFDGDGRADLVVWRPSSGEWYIGNSTSNYSYSDWKLFQWGLPGDVPLAADFDGDGKADLTVWRPSTGTWFIRYSSSNYSYDNWSAYQWGLPGDIPIANDFDGDGLMDLTVWRPSSGEWYIRYSSSHYSYGSMRVIQWGLPGDIPLGNTSCGSGRGC
jgi:FG-GAP-like repeat